MALQAGVYENKEDRIKNGSTFKILLEETI